MSATVQIVRHPDYRKHVTGAHPERPARVDAIDDAIRRAQLGPEVETITPNPAPIDDVLRVHTRAYVDRLGKMAARGGGFLDQETIVGPDSMHVALLAAGGAIAAVDSALSGTSRAAFALVRPPGHHTGADFGMGFCLLNNVAIAVRHAQADHGVARVAIVDFDVHHGNGTQAIFEADPSVLFISLHEHPFWPFTGLSDEIGVGNAVGTTVNVPLPHETGDAGYLRAFDAIVGPALERFQPELICVSAGFDAHWADPLAFMNVSCTGFAALVDRLRRWADTYANGRLTLVLEGGYNLEALGASVVASIQSLAGLPVTDPLGPAPGRVRDRDVEAVIAAVRAAHAAHSLFRAPTDR